MKEKMKWGISLCLGVLCALGTSINANAATSKKTAEWNFEKVKPSSLAGLKIEGTQGKIPSTLDGIQIYCIAQYGKFAQRTKDAQVNAKTTLRIPVTAKGDAVTVKSTKNNHFYNVGGKAATADATTYKATDSDVKTGYVVVYATGNSYLKSIKVTLAKYVEPSSSTGSGSTSTGTTTTTKPSTSGMSKYDANAPVGWGTVGGKITGSSDKNAVVVTTAAELINAMSGTDAKTIYVKGTLTFSGQLAVNGAQNKTVYGLAGSALVNPTHTATVDKTGILMLKNCKNIIMRNLTFKGAGAYDIDGKDNLTVQNCQYLWVDHCDFQDGVDGNFDCNNGSDNICVTWCRFHYLLKPYAGGSGGSNDHRFSDLWGGSDKNTKDLGKLRTTFANCWWDEGCRERQPRVRFGQVHIMNCLYSSSVSNYCIGAAYRSNIYAENCAFTSNNAKKTPLKRYATAKGYTDYNITMKGCLGAADVQQHSGNIAYFIPSNYYSLTAYSASEVEKEVSTYAGATLNITTATNKAMAHGSTTAIDETSATAEIVETRYFTISGSEIPAPQSGLNIVKTKLSNGKTIVKKIMMR